MKRRSFVRSAVSVSLGTPLGMMLPPASEAKGATPAFSPRAAFAVDANHVRFFSDTFKEPLKVLIAADTHLFTDDERGKPFRQYSGRMAHAYNHTRHFQTGEPTNPEESFASVVRQAQETKVDLLALVGDIFSFPSQAAIEWVSEKLSQADVPYLYVAGNHDWHYEGMEGSLETLRATWVEKRLKPLYQGNNPYMAAYEIHGIRFLAIDNSHYQIRPDQLEFFRQHSNSGYPLVLLVHIPLYAPGRSVGFGCGHPDWGAKTDRNYKIERRPRRPESGHTQVTMDFHREVFTSKNLLGIFAGHIHQQSTDVVNGIPQFVTDANAKGATMSVEFIPQSTIDS